jgi:hypothetical protein
MIKIIKVCKVYREYDENYAVLTEKYDFYDIIRGGSRICG